MNVSFHPNPVPTGLLTDTFRLEPLTAAHVELDYQAVMASRHILRVWSGTSWPADDFTLAGNLEDLERHDREHRDGEAFTYTVLDPEGRVCLGCVYIWPLSDLVDSNPEVLADVGNAEAVVGFWVREDRLADGLEGILFETLERWLADQWSFDTLRFSVSSADDRQRSLMESSGLEAALTVSVPRRSGTYDLYQRPSALDGGRFHP